MMQLSASMGDWKLVYRILHTQLRDSEELMDSELMGLLQTRLQDAARAAGVDVGDHAQWDSWLRAASDRAPAAPLKLVD